MDPASLSQLATVHSDVNLACELLAAPNPEAFDRCASILASAIAVLSAWRDSAHAPSEAAAHLAEARSIRRALRKAGRLAFRGAEYHTKWLQALGTLTAGYTAAGEPAELTCRGRVSVRG